MPMQKFQMQIHYAVVPPSAKMYSGKLRPGYIQEFNRRVLDILPVVATDHGNCIRFVVHLDQQKVIAAPYRSGWGFVLH